MTQKNDENNKIKIYSSEIIIDNNDKWVFRGNEITQESILLFFKQSLREDESGIYIENKFHDLTEHGYITVRGFPLKIKSIEITKSLSQNQKFCKKFLVLGQAGRREPFGTRSNLNSIKNNLIDLDSGNQLRFITETEEFLLLQDVNLYKTVDDILFLMKKKDNYIQYKFNRTALSEISDFLFHQDNRYYIRFNHQEYQILEYPSKQI